jgi:hypothetical protein
MFAALLGAVESVAKVWDDCGAADPQTNVYLPQTGKAESSCNWNSPLNVNNDDQVVGSLMPKTYWNSPLNVNMDDQAVGSLMPKTYLNSPLNVNMDDQAVGPLMPKTYLNSPLNVNMNDQLVGSLMPKTYWNSPLNVNMDDQLVGSLMPKTYWNSPLNVNMDDQAVGSFMPITASEPMKILFLRNPANQVDKSCNWNSPLNVKMPTKINPLMDLANQFDNAILLPPLEAEFRNRVAELEYTDLTDTFEDALKRADVDLCNILVEKNLSKLGLEKAIEAAVIGKEKELLQQDDSLLLEAEAQRRIQNALAIFYNATDQKECFNLFKESLSNARMLPQVQEALNKTAFPEMQKVVHSQMSCAKRFFDVISNMGRACKDGVSNLRKRCMQNVSDYANLAIKFLNGLNAKAYKLKKL